MNKERQQKTPPEYTENGNPIVYINRGNERVRLECPSMGIAVEAGTHLTVYQLINEFRGLALKHSSVLLHKHLRGYGEKFPDEKVSLSKKVVDGRADIFEYISI